jgi:hypothetical protein
MQQMNLSSLTSRPKSKVTFNPTQWQAIKLEMKSLSCTNDVSKQSNVSKQLAGSLSPLNFGSGKLPISSYLLPIPQWCDARE